MMHYQILSYFVFIVTFQEKGYCSDFNGGIGQSRDNSVWCLTTSDCVHPALDCVKSLGGWGYYAVSCEKISTFGILFCKMAIYKRPWLTLKAVTQP